MQPLHYFLVVGLSFIGLLAGCILAYFAYEELKPGRKYFELLQKAILAAIIVLLANHFGFSLTWRILIYIAAILLVAFVKLDSILAYPLLAVAIFLAKSSQNTLFLVASLVFLYGLTSGTLAAEGKLRKRKLQQLLGIIKAATIRNSPFLIIAVALGFLS